MQVNSSSCLGFDLDGQLLVGEVGAGQLERLGGLGLVLVDLAGVLVVTARLELFDALLGLVFLGLARGVVVGRHVTHSFRLLAGGGRLLIGRAVVSFGGSVDPGQTGSARQIVHHRRPL